MRLLDRINRTGTTVVMATHDQRIVDAMRRRVIELDHGSLVRDQVARRLRSRELMSSRLAYFTRETLISLRRNLLMTIAGIITVAISLFLFGGILLVSRTVDHGTQQVEARRRARDLHEGRARTQAQMRRDRDAELEGRSRRSSTLQVPEPAGRVRRFQEDLRRPARAGREHEARATCRSRSASCRSRPSSPQPLAARVQGPARRRHGHHRRQADQAPADRDPLDPAARSSRWRACCSRRRCSSS